MAAPWGQYTTTWSSVILEDVCRVHTSQKISEESTVVTRPRKVGGQRECILAVACDRTSNGPHVYYPNHKGTGGMGETEDPVWV